MQNIRPFKFELTEPKEEYTPAVSSIGDDDDVVVVVVVVCDDNNQSK